MFNHLSYLLIGQCKPCIFLHFPRRPHCGRRGAPITYVRRIVVPARLHRLLQWRQYIPMPLFRTPVVATTVCIPIAYTGVCSRFKYKATVIHTKPGMLYLFFDPCNCRVQYVIGLDLIRYIYWVLYKVPLRDVPGGVAQELPEKERPAPDSRSR